MRKITVLMSVGMLTHFLFADTATWTNAVANTPDTAYLWSNADNWQNKTLPSAQSIVGFNLAYNSRAYIRLDSFVSLFGMSTGVYAENAYLLGDVTVCDYSGSARSTLSSAAYIYGDLVVSDALLQSPYFSRLNLCGRLRVLGTESQQLIMSSGSAEIFFNRYARAAGETRTDDLDDINYISVGNGTIMFYAPYATDESTDVWRLVKGSPFATRVTSAPNAILSAGTTVTCASDGFLGEGVFLKHIFDSDTIELSAPAGESGDASLTFAAFTPDFRVGFKNRFKMQGSSCNLQFMKNRADVVARMDIPMIREEHASGHPTMGMTWAGNYPGTFVLHDFDTRVCGWEGDCCRLYYAHLELAGAGTTGMTVAGDKYPFGFAAAAGLATRITVPEGITGKFLKVKQFTGDAIKDGAGTFVIGIASTNNTGALTIEGGTVDVVRHDALEGDLALGTVEMSAGTVLKIPSAGLTVGQLVTHGTVTVSGGPLIVSPSADISAFSAADITFADGACLILKRNGTPASSVVESLPQANVVGHPAFWVDASQTNTMEFVNEDGALYLTRWNDCRAGEPMFCTNIVHRPELHVGTRMVDKYVRLVNVSTTTYADTDQLVWSVPIGEIKTVFLMHDVSDGGGTILGQCWWRLSTDDVPDSWGGAFYRTGYTSISTPILAGGQYSTRAVVDGIFYLDGVRIDPTTTCYQKTAYDTMHLIEFAINPNYNAGYRRHDLICDAFGGCYKEGTAGVSTANGGQRIAECIVYTNELSYAERLQVAQYLMRKWRSTNVRYDAAGESFAAGDEGIQDITGVAVAGSTLEVGEGRAVVAEDLTGGIVTKTGNGLLKLSGIDNTELNVKAGEVKVSAFDESRYLPADTWLHVDAAATGTVVTESDGTTLDRWNDKNGLGESLRSYEEGAKATFVTDAINGLPAIDLGAPASAPYQTKATSSALVYYTADGVVSPGHKELLSAMTAPHISTAFLVYDSSQGGGSLLGGFDAAFPSKGLPHIHQASGDNAMIDAAEYTESTGHGLYYVHKAITNGTAIFHRNGESVDPFKVGFLKGAERVTFRYGEGRVAPVLGGYGQGTKYYGGLKYGEVLLYRRTLTDDEVSHVEDYLARKWFGIKKSGQGAAATTVKVAEGARLTIVGEDFTANALGGSGEISGDVDLNADGILSVDVADGGVVGGPLEIDGVLALKGGKVVLNGASGKIPAGTYTLVTADRIIQADGTTWTVQGSPRCIYQLEIAETAILLTVKRHGMSFIVR